MPRFAVSGKDPCALGAVGSWSILSADDAVNTPMFSVGGQTVQIVWSGSASGSVTKVCGESKDTVI